jgi:hypothetical protein
VLLRVNLDGYKILAMKVYFSGKLRRMLKSWQKKTDDSAEKHLIFSETALLPHTLGFFP